MSTKISILAQTRLSEYILSSMLLNNYEGDWGTLLEAFLFFDLTKSTGKTKIGCGINVNLALL